MNDWNAEQVAMASGARLLCDAGPRTGPHRAVIDSRLAGPGDLFVGLPGRSADGGRFAAQALAAGAWGVLIAPEHAEPIVGPETATVLSAPDPAAALARLARSWRRSLGARVVAITGSTGKTSTKDILAALLGSQLRTAASRENLNTELGLPLAVLEAPAGTQVLVLELAMRGPGQIAELAEICEPDVGVIVNVGPVHLELLGSIEAIAAAKAELIAALAPGAAVVVPADEPLLVAHLRDDLHTVTFGAGGDVRLESAGEPAAGEGEVTISHGNARFALRPSFSASHQLTNLLAAVAAARALGVTPAGPVAVRFSALRGERLALPGGIVIVNDCYNANPMSVRAALEDLAGAAPGRRVAVLGDMLELGPDERHYHVQAGADAVGRVDVLITVGRLARSMAEGLGAQGPEHHAVADASGAAELLADMLAPGDTVLVKGSRAVGLELVAERLAAFTGGSPGALAGGGS